MKSFLTSIAAVALLGGPVIAETVPVTPPPQYSYDAETVMQLKVRGEYGRYLTFVGKSINSYKGTPGYASFGPYGGYFYGGTSGGTQDQKFVYELDCKELTFNRLGDKATGGGRNRGWMATADDPTANAVAQEYCPKISTLPQSTKMSDSEKPPLLPKKPGEY